MYSPLHNPRFMLVGLVSARIHTEKMVAIFEETESLVHTYGGRVYAVAVQNNTRADHATYIGTGKAQEVADTISQEKIDIVVVNASIKPGQLYTLKKIFEPSNPSIIVWDRIDLILHIFRKHAATAEANLQIQLASMRHMGPKIYGMGMVMSQQAGGIGTRGIGETNTELMRRHWRTEIRKVHKQLIKLSQSRQQQMDNRKRHGFATISIVGYTNAGKSMLFNRLTGKNNLVENTLFVTLDSAVGKIFFPSLGREIFITDTIGFIQDLPPQLIDAFKSTLMETVQANLLLHVIDISDPWMYDKIAAVETILRDLAIDTRNQLYVFNKIDRKKETNYEELSTQYSLYSPQFISAKSGAGCSELIKKIQEILVKKQEA